MYLISLGPRKSDYQVLADTRINKFHANALAQAANDLWDAAIRMDLASFGNAMTRSFEAQVAMFPLMVDEEILSVIEKYKNQSYGYKISGAGGGGYLIICSDKKIDDAIQIQIRRK